MPPTDRRKPGRRSTVAEHPQRQEIEAAMAVGRGVRHTAERFRLSRSAVYRFWNGLPARYRQALIRDANRAEGLRLREFATALAAIGRRHPAAQPEISALIKRARHLSTTGGRAHAA